MQSVRPMIWLAVMTPQSTVPDGLSGAVSLTAPSISTPTLLYLSMRVRSMTNWRAPSTGA